MLYVCGLGDDGLILCQLKQLAAMMWSEAQTEIDVPALFLNVWSQGENS